ncbi:MAG: peptidase, partial [Planctomycetia bacterium]|nr:peptidase [Planctomycetia bacterium]
MIFAPPPATRFDLNFRLLGFPVRIHPFFWLSTVLLGTYGGRLAEKETAIRVLAFVLAAFISILVHELGHALTIRWYGRQSQVIL